MMTEGSIHQGEDFISLNLRIIIEIITIRDIKKTIKIIECPVRVNPGNLVKAPLSKLVIIITTNRGRYADLSMRPVKPSNPFDIFIRFLSCPILLRKTSCLSAFRLI